MRCSHCGFDVPNIYEFYLITKNVQICERCHLHLIDDPTYIPRRLLREIEEVLRGIDSWIKETA